jgi:hypothetical protein
MINLSTPSCARLYLLLSVLLIVVSVFLGAKYLQIKTELEVASSVIEGNKFRANVAEFGQLFVEKVLKSNQEVDFETRLKLENQVRNLKDDTIFRQWNQFISSKDEAEAQASVKDLLSSIMSKVYSNK